MTTMITSLFAALALSAADDVTVGRIAELQALIKPRPEETRWEQIPWQVDLWDARKRSAREGKPIMLWEMDGNPMGCG
jgi:hypothetical protein